MKSFKWEVPEYFNFSRDIVDKFAEQDGWVVVVVVGVVTFVCWFVVEVQYGAQTPRSRAALWWVGEEGEVKLTYAGTSPAVPAVLMKLSML